MVKKSAKVRLSHDNEPILFDEIEYNSLIDNEKVCELYFKHQRFLEIRKAIRDYYRSKKI